MIFISGVIEASNVETTSALPSIGETRDRRMSVPRSRLRLENGMHRPSKLPFTSGSVVKRNARRLRTNARRT